MARSMTAYAQAMVPTLSGMVQIQLQSVNRKGLDVAIQLPGDWLFLDSPIRKCLREWVVRGTVSLKLALSPSLTSTIEEKYEYWSQVAKKLGYKPAQAIPFPWLLSSDSRLTSTKKGALSEETLTREVLDGLETVIAAWIEMKEKEGAALANGMAILLSKVQDQTKKLQELAKQEPKDFQARLKKRLSSIEGIPVIEEERLLREMLLFADKVDVSEELERLLSHCMQFHSYLHDANQPSIGQELNFLVREMIREVNTCGAKLQNLSAIRLTLTMKSDLEKLREQLQNLE